jgi:hypothetical protein
MTTEELSEVITRIWVKAMPQKIAVPEDYAVFLWSKRSLDNVTYAIHRTAEKMAKLMSDGQQVSIEQAQRYTTSVLMSRVEWRRERQASPLTCRRVGYRGGHRTEDKYNEPRQYHFDDSAIRRWLNHSHSDFLDEPRERYCRVRLFWPRCRHDSRRS